MKLRTKELSIVGKKPSLLTRAEIERATGLALAAVKRVGEINVAFVDLKRMAELNRNYRKKDKPTDVLSFAYQASKRGPVQGDVVICAAYAKRDCQESGTPYKEQLLRLIVHGVMHICGYDHIKAADAKRMLPLQEKILGRL